MENSPTIDREEANELVGQIDHLRREMAAWQREANEALQRRAEVLARCEEERAALTTELQQIRSSRAYRVERKLARIAATLRRLVAGVVRRLRAVTARRSQGG